MTDSLTDMLTNVTQPDLIIFAAGLGGVLMWANWYRKGAEKDQYFHIDTTNKRIRLGLYLTGLVGMLSGSAVGFLANSRGWETNDAALLAFFGGLGSTWLAKVLVNNSYAGVCQIAQSKWFADNLKPMLPTRPALPSPTHHGSKAMTSHMPPHSPIPASHYEQKVALTGELIGLKEQGLITEAKLRHLHNLIPDLPDSALVASTQQLAIQHQNLTIAEKADLTSIILTQQKELGRATGIIDLQQAKLERAGLTLEPQHRIPKEVLYVSIGAIARHVLGWIL